MRIYFLIINMLLLLVPPLYAQQYSFNYLTSKDGLSNSSINCVYNDSRGYTWLGTVGGGLCRYNGKNVMVYTKNEGLAGNYINCITEDKSGNIWIGTTEGASKFDGKIFQNFTQKNGLVSNSVYAIVSDASGKIFIGSDGGGICILNQNKFSYLSKKDGLPTDTVYSLAIDKKGVLWIGFGSRGAVSFDGKHIERLTQIPELCRNTYFTICVDSKDNKWFGSPAGLLYKLSENSLQKMDLPPPLKGNFISHIYEDKWAVVWVATSSGILQLKDDKQDILTKANGLSSDNVTNFSSDQEGNVWISTFDAGISIFTNKPITLFNEKNGFENSNINALFAVNDSDLLVATSGPGLFMLSNSKLSKINTHSAIDQSEILTLIQNSNQEYLVGTQSDGVFIMDASFKLKKQLKELNGIPLERITQLAYNQNKALIISTFGSGIFVLEESGKSQHFKSTNSSLISDNVLAMHAEKSGKIFIGLYEKGLQEFDGKSFYKITLPSNKESSSVYCFENDGEGTSFIGSGEDGLFVQSKQGLIKKYGEAEGLCSNTIQSLLYDSIGHKLWVGTNKGINVVTFSAALTLESIDFIGENKGLAYTEIAKACLVRTSKGIVWIGTLSGLFAYDFTMEKSLNVIPKVLLNQVMLFNKETDWSKFSKELDPWTGLPNNLHFSYNENQFLYRFSAPGSDKNRLFQYRILEYEKDWSPAVSGNEAIYSSIPPGNNYEFQVRLIGPDGKAGPITSFNFSISPPFWRTWWFYSLVFLSLFLSIVAYIRYRERSLVKEKKHLEEKVEERTTELKQTNDLLSEAFTDIKDSINYAQRIQEAILPMESIIRQVFPDSFILFKPRDVVSGDFYWFGTVEKEGEKHHIIAAADCTGHGVPGAFMSMIGNTILSEIVVAKEVIDPGQILLLLHQGIRKALKQDLTTSRDGMDICLCSINLNSNKVKYAGAYNPLWILRNNNEIEIVKANKCAIGGFTEDHQVFESHELQLNKGDALYLFTDGYADQFGGEQGKKLTAKKFREGILSVADQPMKQQKFFYENLIDIWKGKEFQVDDILVIGLRIG